MEKTMKNQPNGKWLTGFVVLFVLLLWPISGLAQQPSVMAANDGHIIKDEKTKRTDAAKDERTKDKATPTATPVPSSSGKGLASNLNLLIDIGAQGRTVTGERPSKFEEYKRVRQGFWFRRFSVASNPAGSPRFFRLIGRGPSERDQEYLFDGGEYGRSRTTVQWNELQRLFSRGARTPYTLQSNGVLVTSDAIKATLQPLLDAKSTTMTAVAESIFRNAALTTVRQTRQTLSINQMFQITPHWGVRAKFLDYRRYGTRPLGIGSYERVPTPNAEIGITTTIGDGFRVLNLELPERIDSRTDQITFGTSYVTRHWGMNFDYTYSWFNNRVEALTFDNPFRLTDKQATSNGNFNRQEFARGIFAEEPDNRSHSFLVSAFVDLPGHSRLAGALGWSFWRQNSQFLPFTLNTAITAANLPAGVTPTSLAALPRQSLQGQVDTFSADQVFASRPTKNFSFDIRYRSYDYNNKTPDILFPGYAAFSESFWRTSIVGTFGTELIENKPVSFHRQNFIAEGVWDVAKWLKWQVEYQWEGWDREHRQVANSNENTVGTQLSYKPNKKFDGKLIYRYSDRTPRAYSPGVLEFQQLRLFDQAKRIRHHANVQWQYAVTPKLGLSGTFSYLRDNYDKNFFGLVRYLQGQGSVDMLYTPNEKTTFYANYSRERYSSSLQSITKTGAPFQQVNPAAPCFTPNCFLNRWNREDRNVNDSFGIGVTTYLAKNKLFFDVNYALSLSNDRITTVNPSAVVATAALNATAFPFPDVKSNYHELNVDTNYQLKDNLALGFRYIFEPYRLNDFQWNGLNPYPFESLPAEQQFPTTRSVLLDSRYSSHNAHVFSVYLRFQKGKQTGAP
jgi:MtrB/PioB family decaheme-associated outer membrane protein